MSPPPPPLAGNLGSGSAGATPQTSGLGGDQRVPGASAGAPRRTGGLGRPPKCSERCPEGAHVAPALQQKADQGCWEMGTLSRGHCQPSAAAGGGPEVLQGVHPWGLEATPPCAHTQTLLGSSPMSMSTHLLGQGPGQGGSHPTPTRGKAAALPLVPTPARQAGKCTVTPRRALLG